MEMNTTLGRSLKYSLVLSFMAMFSGCAGNGFYHDYLMSAQIVEANKNQVVLCIGSESAAEIGMQFSVFEVISTGSMTDGTDSYNLNRVGEVEIESIIGKHFARARILQGNIQKYNLVKLGDDWRFSMMITSANLDSTSTSGSE